MSEEIIMGYWDCPSCGSTGIKGTIYDCPNCGRQRGKETKFYMRKDKIEYVPGHKVVGADWYCDYCGALNSAARNTCENCGSAKSESKDDYFSLKEKEQEQEYKDNIVNNISADNINLTEQETVNNSTKIAVRIMIALMFLMIFILFKILNAPKIYTYNVQKTIWENSIDIEEYKTVQESGWSLPSDGRLIRTNEEIKSYKRVLDHYRDVRKSRRVQNGSHTEYSYHNNGDGTFTQRSHSVPDYTTEYYTEQEPVYIQVPVYDTKYYYDIDKWVYEKTETTTGTDKSPYWKELTLTNKERETDRETKYSMEGIQYSKSLFGKDKEKLVTYILTEDDWQQIDAGQTLEITVKFNEIQNYQIIN